jgi:hypothetical protein
MEKLVAYVGRNRRDGMGVDRVAGSTHDLADWNGNRIGYCTLGRGWRVQSYIGTHMHQIYAWIGGREYTGRGFGEGLSVVLRETAASRRKRAA